MGHAAGSKHQRRVRVDFVIPSQCSSSICCQAPATSAQAKAAKAQHAASQLENTPPQSTSGHDDKAKSLPQAGESEAEPKQQQAQSSLCTTVHHALCTRVPINPVPCR